MKNLLLVMMLLLLATNAIAQDAQQKDLTFNDFVGLWENSDQPGLCYDIRVNQGKLEFWTVNSPAWARKKAEEAHFPDPAQTEKEIQSLLVPSKSPAWNFDGEDKVSRKVEGGEQKWHAKYSSILRGNEIFLIELYRSTGPTQRSKVNGVPLTDPRPDLTDIVEAKYYRIALSHNRQVLTIRDFYLHLDQEEFPNNGDAGLYYGPENYTKVEKCE